MLVERYLKSKDIKKAQFARMLNISAQNLGKRLNGKTMSVQHLYEYSRVLKHNFFMELSAEFDRETVDINEYVLREPEEKYKEGPLEQVIGRIVQKELDKRLK